MISKVTIELERDDDGFPPIEVEMLNAEDLGSWLFRIKNAPFFATNISYDDIVKASQTEISGQYRFEKVVEQSRFTAISIVIFNSSMDVFLMDLLRGLGCVVEYGEFGVYRVLAVAVPESTDYAPLREQLQSLEDRELISFAELAILD